MATAELAIKEHVEAPGARCPEGGNPAAARALRDHQRRGCDERKPEISNAFLVFLQYYSSALPTLVCYHSGAPLWYNKGVMTEVDQ